MRYEAQRPVERVLDETLSELIVEIGGKTLYSKYDEEVNYKPKYRKRGAKYVVGKESPVSDFYRARHRGWTPTWLISKSSELEFWLADYFAILILRFIYFLKEAWYRILFG